MLVLSFYASTSMRYYHFMLVLKWRENKKNGVENGGKINAMVGKNIFPPFLRHLGGEIKLGVLP